MKEKLLELFIAVWLASFTLFMVSVALGAVVLLVKLCSMILAGEF